jgi:hypothetical protein
MSILGFAVLTKNRGLEQGPENFELGIKSSLCLDLYIPWAKNDFYIFKWLKNKKHYVLWCDMKFKFALLLQHNHAHIHLYIIYGCCHTKRAELSTAGTKLYSMHNLKHLLPSSLQNKLCPLVRTHLKSSFSFRFYLLTKHY